MSTKAQEGSVTADDVAELAGVSRWTVSRAFKKDASISKTSLEKVMHAAQKLGYAPDLMAASLASDKSNLVALLIDDFVNPHKLVMMEALTRALHQNGWDTLLVNTIRDQDASAALLHASQRRVDAAVLIGSKFSDRGLTTALGAKRVKKLIVFARYSSNPNTISICCDDKAAMETMANHVLQRGYKRPVFLAGPQTQSAHLMRKEAFENLWLCETGYLPKSELIGAYDTKLTFEFVTDYLAKLPPHERPDVLVCENDAIAIGAIDAIHHANTLTIPRDIAVTGFDDVPLGSSPHYRLTTYRQPITRMANGLIDVLKGSDDHQALNEFTGEIVIRESA